MQILRLKHGTALSEYRIVGSINHQCETSRPWGLKRYLQASAPEAQSNDPPACPTTCVRFQADPD
ncbi:uncharacterized protein METZ01_LOCUS78002, partial [marine metagenome]